MGTAALRADRRDLPAAGGADVSCQTSVSTATFTDLPLRSTRRRRMVRWRTALDRWRSEEHTSELETLMRIPYAVFCLKKNKSNRNHLYVDCTTAHTNIHQ